MYCFQFAVLLLVLLLIQIAIGIYVFVTINREGWEPLVDRTIRDSFNITSPGPVPTEVDNLQRDVSQCCMLKKYGPIFYPVQLLA